jgi:APA family basic amino acid/polyamine antiporter
VFFAVFGYDAMSTAAEEARDGNGTSQGHRVLAGRVDGAVRAAILVLTGMQNYRDIDPESGFSTATG